MDVLDLSRDPLKQFVRKHGWLTAAQRKMSELNEKHRSRPFGLRYFTLCGKDGIDIFMLRKEELLKDDGRKFPSVVYCESLQSNFAKVRPLLGGTKGYLSSFEDLVKRPEFKSKTVVEPFDLVNLDFSGSCFPISEQPFSNTLHSILDLISLQKASPFCLLVTFKAFRSGENQEAINELLDNMHNNFRDHQEIEGVFNNCFNQMTPQQLLENDYGLFLLASFPKIIFGFGSSNGFIVSCYQKYYYARPKRNSLRSYQIIKFIFDLKPFDTSSFTEMSQLGRILHEKYVQSTLNDLQSPPVNVDDRLRQNPSLNDDLSREYQEIIDEIKALGT
jgi:hypothetical protein